MPFESPYNNQCPPGSVQASYSFNAQRTDAYNVIQSNIDVEACAILPESQYGDTLFSLKIGDVDVPVNLVTSVVDTLIVQSTNNVPITIKLDSTANEPKTGTFFVFDGSNVATALFVSNPSTTGPASIRVINYVKQTLVQP